MTTSAFHRLHPRLRHAIVNELGWRELRPVQELAINAVLDGCNAIVLAPTAGGKTEAAFFPALSQTLEDESPPVSVLYVCPIKALLNNQEHRVKRYTRMIGLDAFKWHGDVGAPERRRFLDHHTHVLMTTPESLEVMLINRPGDVEAQFAGLSTVIVDEVHAFAGDDRGSHLVSILERLTRFCGRDLQRIGLSATVGNPAEIGSWLTGSSRRPVEVINPPRPPVARDMSVELVDDDEERLVREVTAIGLGKKSLVFVETRGLAEQVAAAMKGAGVTAFVHHGSVSKEDRERTEAQFQTGSNVAIICTSTLELGIDVGDLDHVMQIDAPFTVSSLLQRMGRTGRRDGSVSNCHFLCHKPFGVLLACGLMRLADAGWVEDIEPDYRATHVLAHQVMAISLQEAGVSRHRVLPWIASATPYRELGESDLELLTDTMLSRKILYESEGRLSLGDEGEKLYAGQNFLKLYSVFDTPPIFVVRHGRRDIGTLDIGFIHLIDPSDGPGLFRLAGRPWVVLNIDWRRGVCFVEPAPSGRVPRWGGGGGFLSYEVCQSMKAVLREKEAYPWLRPSAALELDSLRLGYADVVPRDASVIELAPEGTTWHTFAGGRINAVLGAALERNGGDWVVDNLYVKTKDKTAAAGAVQAISDLESVDMAEVAHGLAASRGGGPFTKFQPCLPQSMERELYVRIMLDPAGAQRFVREPSLVFTPR